MLNGLETVFNLNQVLSIITGPKEDYCLTHAVSSSANELPGGILLLISRLYIWLLSTV